MPINEDSYQLTNDRGVEVDPFGSGPTLAFTRSSSQIRGGRCIVEVATIGDYIDDLGHSYKISNGVLEATFTPEELFSGQAAGPATLKDLQPTG